MLNKNATDGRTIVPAIGGFLSQREAECLSLLAQGLRTQRIAERMAISPATVEFHFKNARRKLGAHTREHALAISVRNGWVEV